MNSNESRCIIAKSVNLKNNFKSPSQRRYPDSPVCGGTFSDFELAWLYNGPILKIFDVANGTVVSSWDFTSVTHDNRTEITSIIEYVVPESMHRNATKESQMYFIVGYTSSKDSSRASFISLCHPRTSRILHTITTKEKITCLSLITSRKDHSSPITGVVKLMCGALAVGTIAGNLLIVDIKEIFSSARQGCGERTHNRFSEMVILDHKHSESSIKDKLNRADEYHHIALSLPISDRRDIEVSDLKITVVTYIPQCTMLAVGLTNGVFQLWDVSTLKRLHRSSLSGAQLPVVKFGFQEPCNDPQSFCYLWVLYESQSEQSECLPFAIMYACFFKKIITVPEHGVLYKNFQHCKKRFDLDVDLERCVSGRCIACSVVSNTPSNILRHVTTSIEEDAAKINLFVIVFETWERITDNNSCITMIIFDMNQWYRAQMPQLVYQGGSVPFVNFQSLEHVSERKGTVMDVLIKKDTIQQFLSFNLSEEYSYPSSLSFDALILTDSRLVHARVPGAQRNILDKIVTEGPSGIINPNKYFSECKDAGLWPCFSNTFSHMFVPNQVQQRNFILTVLLEHKFSSFLVQCAKQWADGSRGVSGCTLPNLIKWAWDCVTRIKQLTDTVCIPLFDYSGDDLDRENYQKLKHCVQLMHTIRDLLAFIHRNYKQYLLEDAKLKHQLDALKLITKYFDVIIWCLDCNLLPEKVTSSSEKCVPTYMMSLMQYSEQRRDELRNIVMKDQYFLTENTTLYIIDSVLELESNGKKMRAQWERESGGLSNGSYPPVTLQSLIRMFLMPDLSDDAKHFIMIYFLLDVCDYHRDEDMKEQLLSFSVVFSIDSTFFSLVQACWFIDHEKFEDAAALLLNDSVILQLKKRRDLYQTLTLACVCQGQYQLALRIERLIKLSRTVFNGDTFYVTLLLLNGLVMDAYFTMKENTFKQKGLLKHFFKVCDNLGYLKEVFKFPLSVEEEEEFITYLDMCSNKDAGDLKVMYLLSRGRYVEAIDVNHELGSMVPKFNVVGQDTTKQKTGVGRTTTRDLLVNAFSKTLPAVTNDLINFCRKEKNKIARFKAVSKPIPLSVVVHTDTSHQIPIYKSSFESVMEAAICKTAETWANVPEILKQKRGQLNLKNTPFLRSDFTTPRKDHSLFSQRVRPLAREEKTETVSADEPPTKRVRRNISMSADTGADELPPAYESNKLSNSPETSKILCTPHVQKRLNKLLQNTPESSPLTSILKSAESRFKQPQKVGFSVPEADVRRSKRINALLSTPSPETHNENLTSKNVEKMIKSPVDSIVSPEKASTSMNESLNTSITSAAQDSFYSLDSGSDSAFDIPDFVPEISVHTRTSKFMVEPMSVDEKPSYIHRLNVESMSEEETTPQLDRVSELVVESMSEEETPLSSRASRLVIESMSEPEVSQSSGRSETIVETRTEEKNLQTLHGSKLVVESTIERETLLPTRLQFGSDQMASGPQNVQVEIHTPPSAIKKSVCAVEILNIQDDSPNLSSSERETTTFAALQPVENSSSMHQLDVQHESYSTDSFREEFSIDTCEKETVLEQCSEEDPSTNSDDDSDVEILAESSQVEPVTGEDENQDADTEVNENLSERSYDSDYSNVHESVRTDSETEDEIQEIEDEGSSIEEEVSIKDDDDVEEEEDVEEEDDGEEDEDDEAEDSREEESEAGVPEVHNLSDEEADDEEEREEDKQYDVQDTDIDYDSLKKIMSAVNAAESGKTKLSTELQSTHTSSSFLCNETTASAYEVVDVDLSTTMAEPTVTEGSVLVEKIEITSDTSVVEVANQSLDTSVEVLSMSCVDKEKTANESEVFFFFGETSAASISEKLSGNESMNDSQLNVTGNVAEISQKTDNATVERKKSFECSNRSGNKESLSPNVSKESNNDVTQNREDFSLEAVDVEDDNSERTKYSGEDIDALNDVTHSSDQTQNVSASVVEEISGDATQRTENFSIMEVEEKEETDSSDGEIEATQRTEDFSIMDIEEKEEETDSSDEEIDVSSVVEECSRQTQNPVEKSSLSITEEAVDYSITTVTEEREESMLEPERTFVEDTNSSKANDDFLNESKWKSVQSQNVSIGLVEEMVGDVTSQSEDLLNVSVISERNVPDLETVESNVEVEKGAKTSHEKITASNEPKQQRISIGVTEEIVACYTPKSEDDYVPERTDKLKETTVKRRSPRKAKQFVTGSPVSEPVVANESSPAPSIPAQTMDRIETVSESPNKTVATNDQTCREPNVVRDIKVVLSRSSLSDSLNTTVTKDSRSPVSQTPSRESPVAGASSDNDHAQDPESQTLSGRVNLHQPAAEKAESECSEYQMILPDSPAAVDVEHPSTDSPEPSRRSIRIARRQSIDIVPQPVASESAPIETRPSRKRSMDSVDIASVKSDTSVPESLGSRKSNTRKRSFTKMEMRKSSVKSQFKPMEVILSDEEFTGKGIVSEDDRSSSVSKTSRSSRYSLNTKLNNAVIETPSPPLKKRALRQTASTTSPVKQKTEMESDDYQNYTDSRRLTRRQKSLLDYGITRFPQTSESSRRESVDTEGREIAPQDSSVAEKMIEPPTVRARPSRRPLKEKEQEQERRSLRPTRSNKLSNRAEANIPADSDSSDDSTYSKGSTASRRSKTGRRSIFTGTKVELRKSSVKPQLKELDCISSGDESVEPESRLPAIRRSTRTQKNNEAEHSDRESLHSNVSGSPSSRVVRRTRRSSIVTVEPAKLTPTKSQIPAAKRKK